MIYSESKPLDLHQKIESLQSEIDSLKRALVLKHKKDESPEEPNKRSKLEQCRAVAVRVCASSKLHGLTNIVVTQNVAVKLMWSMLLLISTGGCIYFLTKVSFDYMNYEVITKIHSISQNPMLFPAFVICNLYNPNNTIDKMLFSCAFDKNEVCGPSDFEVIYVYDQVNFEMLKCFRFNSGWNVLNQSVPLREASTSGYLHGLHMKLYLPNQNEFITYALIHNHVRPIYNELFHIIDGGHTTDIILDKTVETKLHRETNLCKSNHEWEPADRSYRRINCYENCLFARAILRCNCSYSRKCETEKDCIKNVFESSNNMEECGSVCPKECTTTTFKMNVQSIRYNPAEEKLNKDRERIARINDIGNVSSNELKLKILSIFIFYEELKYTEIEQILKMPIGDYISLLGGTIGLFLGMSLLSCLEFAEYLLEIIYIMLFG